MSVELRRFLRGMCTKRCIAGKIWARLEFCATRFPRCQIQWSRRICMNLSNQVIEGKQDYSVWFFQGGARQFQKQDSHLHNFQGITLTSVHVKAEVRLFNPVKYSWVTVLIQSLFKQLKPQLSLSKLYIWHENNSFLPKKSASVALHLNRRRKYREGAEKRS